MNKTIKNVLTVTLIVGAFVMGRVTADDIEVVDNNKTIVASQMASDGETQVTYSDGTSETFQMDFIAQKNIKIEAILTESTENFHIEKGEYGIELSDGSWASVNLEKNHYEFQPVELGDWSYELENLTQLENVIKTYLEYTKY